MSSYYHPDRHFATRFLIAGALALALIALIPVIPASPAAAAPRQSRLTPLASVAPVEHSKVVLSDTSVDAPALWTSDPRSPTLGLTSVLAWTGTNSGHSLNIMTSADGLTYGSKMTFAESSATRPAVAAQGAPLTVVLAWTGTNSGHSLNLLCHGPACGATNGYKKITLSASAFGSPSLSPYGSAYLMAWAGTDTNHTLHILPIGLNTSSGFSIGSTTTLSQFGAVATPSLSYNPVNNQVLLTWASNNPVNGLAFATSSDGIHFTGAQRLSASSAASPAGYAVASSEMPAYWMAWTDASSSHALHVAFTPSFPQWPASDSAPLAESAFDGPALGYVGDTGETLLAWTGPATHQMNIATITTPAAATLDQRIDSYIAGLSTTQLIGQTLMFSVCSSGYNSNIDQALKQWDAGSVIIYTSCGGGTVPPTAAGLRSLDQAMQSNANHAGTLLIGIDEEGGTVDRLAPYYGGTPGARQLANTGAAINAWNQAKTDAGRMRSLGLNADFAPVADVDQGGGEGPARMFGTSVGVVDIYAGAFLDGLQESGVAGTLKHWPGLGAATGNPDFVLPTINQTQAQMSAIDFAPFAQMRFQQPGMIMVTTVMAPAFDSKNPAMLSSTLVTGQLRNQLGYQGVIITDALGAQGLIAYMKQQGYSNPTAGIAEASVRAFVAGDDLLLCPLSQSQLSAIVSAMNSAVASGRISRSRLVASVHRIIKLKAEMGLISL